MLQTMTGEVDRVRSTASRIVIADDHPLYRQMLAQLLSRAPGIDALEPVASYGAALALIRASNPDLALLDLHMPEMDGVAGIARARELCPQTRVAVISGIGTAGPIRDVLASGACGFVPKTLGGDTIVAAVRLMLAGVAYLPPNTLLDDPATTHETGRDRCRAGAPLTPRELEVLRLLTDGLANKGIARQLSITETTVKLHVRRILQKLAVRNRTAAAALAVSRALVTAAGGPCAKAL